MGTDFEVALPSARATRALGKRLGRVLQAGDTVALVGDLGAGKTTFTQGLAAGLGVPADARVRSPTFAIAHVYPGGRVTLYHVDVYRLETESALWALGFEDYIAGDGVCVVEWADRVPAALPEDHLVVRFEARDGGRLASVRGTGTRSGVLALALAPRP